MHSIAIALTMISAATPPALRSFADASSLLHERTFVVAQAPTSPPSSVELAPPPAAPATAAPAPASAPAPDDVTPPLRQAAPSNRDLSIWAVLPYNYGSFGYGVGARFALPLPIPSLLPAGRIRDNWSIEFGADYVRYSLGYLSSNYAVNWFLPVVGVRWNVWLNDDFAVYPKVEAGYEVAWISGFPSGYSSPSYGGAFVSGAAGLLYKIASGKLTLRAEAGSFGVKGGIGAVF